MPVCRLITPPPLYYLAKISEIAMFHFEPGRNGVSVAQTKCVKKLDSSEMPMKNSLLWSFWNQNMTNCSFWVHWISCFMFPLYDKLSFWGSLNFRPDCPSVPGSSIALEEMLDTNFNLWSNKKERVDLKKSESINWALHPIQYLPQFGQDVYLLN